MIVCLCHGVDESEIKELVEEGADSLAAVGRACGAGTDCGACRGQIEAIIEEVCEAEAICGKRRLRVA